MRVKEAQRKVNLLNQTMDDLEKAMLFFRKSDNGIVRTRVTEEAELSTDIVEVLKDAYEAAAERKRDLEFRIGMAEIA